MTKLIPVGVLFFSVAFTGCAGAKVKNERMALQPGSFSKSDLILVKRFDADQAVFSGDKSADVALVSSEKSAIHDKLAGEIVYELKSLGYNAKVLDGEKTASAILLDGTVTKVEHGSGAARMFLGGFGVGTANLYATVRMRKGTDSTIADFDLVATSGASSNSGSFVSRHLEDGAKKTAEYISSRIQ